MSTRLLENAGFDVNTEKKKKPKANQNFPVSSSSLDACPERMRQEYNERERAKEMLSFFLCLYSYWTFLI